MQANKILQADLLDIIFDGRNKDYGAYQLRRTYNKRLIKAMAGVAGAICLIFITTDLFSKMKKDVKVEIPTTIGIDLTGINELQKEEEKKVELPPPIPPKPIEEIKVQTTRFVDPRFAPNEEVATPPPTNEELLHVKIGLIDQDGLKIDNNMVVPTLIKNVTTVTPDIKPKIEENKGSDIFTTVQIPAKFPGGEPAWRKYLERNLNNNLPTEMGAAVGIYAVVVSFIVDKEGKISDVRAENDPGFGCADEAVRIIKRGPDWIPAIQNGRNVTYRQKQKVVFQILDVE